MKRFAVPDSENPRQDDLAGVPFSIRFPWGPRGADMLAVAVPVAGTATGPAVAVAAAGHEDRMVGLVFEDGYDTSPLPDRGLNPTTGKMTETGTMFCP